MKKVIKYGNGNRFNKAAVIGLIALMGFTSVSALRWFDQNWFQYDLPYGYFHYPPNRTIPFFRSGEVEPGKIGKFGIRESSSKGNISCHFILLGDSQTFGSGIFWEDTFSEILNRETKCQWTNVSMPGFTLENEFAVFQKIQKEIPFEEVFLVVYGNDIYETGDTPDYLHFLGRQKWYIHFMSLFVPEYTRLVLKKLYFDSVQVRMDVEIQKFAHTEFKQNKKKSNNVEVELGDELFPSFRTLYSISPNYFKESLNVNSEANQNFKRWKRVFRRFHMDLIQNKKKLNLVYIPLDVEFDPIRFQVYQKIGFPMDERWLEGDSEFVLALQTMAKEFGMKFIDMRSSFRNQKQLLQKEDIHFNEKANRLMADRIKDMF
ncbi:SGNH/GDSL hydrolase family protein [Leptospira biflexa]|uniref:SGNH/GDSL hydrolase family protein n=1 Tax=Leptospira biflexa TaxID=172 RepID=UPI001091587C|nr:SGNH/GDSL hydrolase family protein [Leptospira biflexa]TGM42415.1 SGNH/GDSL hydrolase family protein [Leptospira biflexa]TGM44301.1 SGNH/GDSL hydrolase family protein [Leptospira biflexa]